MFTIIIDDIVVKWFKEPPNGEEISKVLLRNLTYLAHKLQASCIRTVQCQWVFAQFLKEGGVE